MSGNVPGLTFSQGWLPYGSNDASVVFQHPLTSRPVSNSVGSPGSGNLVPYTVSDAANPAGGGPQYDSVKGIKCADIVTNNSFRGGLIFDTTTLSNAIVNALGVQGQLSFEVEATAITAVEATFFSTGFVATNYGTTPTMLRLTGGLGNGTDTIAVCNPSYFNGQTNVDFYVTPGGGGFQLQSFLLNGHKLITSDVPNTNTQDFIGNAGTGFQSARTIAAGGPTGQIHSFGKGPFVKINVGWLGSPSGGIAFMAVNGLLLGVVRRGNPAPAPANHSLCERFTIGVGLFSNDATGAPSFYMRNLQISSAAPQFAIKPGFFRIAVFGDSTTPTNTAGWDIHFGGNGDLNTMRVIQQAFQQIGYFVETFGSQNSGNTIDDNNNTPSNTTLQKWKNSITPQYLGDASLTTYNPPAFGIPWPDVIVVRGGVNDVAGDLVSGSTYQNPPVILQDSRFLASLDRLVNYWMWGQLTNAVVSNGTRTPVKRIVLVTPQSVRWAGNGWGNNPKPAATPGSITFAYNYMYSTLLAYPARWNARYPSFAGLVSVADYAAFIGGDNYAFSGTPGSGSTTPPNLSADGVHPTIAGGFAVGQCVAQELLRVFNLS